MDNVQCYATLLPIKVKVIPVVNSLCTIVRRHMGIIVGTPLFILTLQHYMEVSCQLHAPVPLSQNKERQDRRVDGPQISCEYSSK